MGFRWGFWGGILFDFLQNGSQNWEARIYATMGGYCIGCEGVGAHGDVVSGMWRWERGGGVICNILFPVFSQSYFPAYFISGFFLGRPLLVSFLSIVCLFSIR